MGKNDSPIKELRESIGVSQRELADALGVHHAFIVNLEMSMIDIKDEDEETRSKIDKVFDKLSEYSGIPKSDLIEKQISNTELQQITIRERVIEQIGKVAEEYLTTAKITNTEEYDNFVHSLETDSINSDNIKSPLKVIRDIGGITQRQFSQAIGVSQTLIARIELGELSLAGPNGRKIIDLVLEGLGIYEAEDDNLMDLYEEIDRLQSEYIKKTVEKNKRKVESAFLKLNKGKKGMSEVEEGKEQGNLG